MAVTEVTVRNAEQGRLRYLPLLAGVLLLVVAPYVLPLMYIYIAMDILIFALFATSLNLIMGYGGMVSFGHAAYFSVAAYTAAVLATKFDASFTITMFVGPVAALVAGLVFGYFCVRLTSVYFSMLTLAFAQVVYTIIFQWYEVTKGDTGIVGLVAEGLLSDPVYYYYFTAAVVTACIGILYLIVRSPFGYVVQAIRENPRRVRLLGVNVRLYQLLAFAIAAFFAGVAGVLFVWERGGAYPEYAGVANSLAPLVMVLLGGMYHFFGPSVGALIYTLLHTFITKYTEYWQWILALIIIVCIVVFPQGLMGVVRQREARAGIGDAGRRGERAA